MPRMQTVLRLFFFSMTTKTADDNVERGQAEKQDSMPVEEFIPDKWVFNEIPKKNDQPFTGFKPKAYIVTRHCYPLCMFLLVYSCYIVFARVVLSSIFRLHQLCFGHFFILSVQHFCMYEIDPQRVRQWFCDIKHWQQVKRFFIVFDPHTDAQHKDDKLE